MLQDDRLQRTRLMLGDDAVEKLKKANVIIFGVGGVGGNCAEALIRCGVGRLTVVDNDDVDVTNINRQVVALHSTIGRPKTEVIGERLRDIAPDAEIIEKQMFFLPETAALAAVNEPRVAAERALAGGVQIVLGVAVGEKELLLAGGYLFKFRAHKRGRSGSFLAISP